MEMAGLYGGLCVYILKKTTKLFLNFVVPFYIPPSIYEKLSSSTSLPTLGKVSYFNFTHLHRCVVVSYFVCVSL